MQILTYESQKIFNDSSLLGFIQRRLHTVRTLSGNNNNASGITGNIYTLSGKDFGTFQTGADGHYELEVPLENFTDKYVGDSLDENIIVTTDTGMQQYGTVHVDMNSGPENKSVDLGTTDITTTLATEAIANQLVDFNGWGAEYSNGEIVPERFSCLYQISKALWQTADTDTETIKKNFGIQKQLITKLMIQGENHDQLGYENWHSLLTDILSGNMTNQEILNALNAVEPNLNTSQLTSDDLDGAGKVYNAVEYFLSNLVNGNNFSENAQATSLCKSVSDGQLDTDILIAPVLAANDLEEFNTVYNNDMAAEVYAGIINECLIQGRCDDVSIYATAVVDVLNEYQGDYTLLFDDNGILDKNALKGITVVARICADDFKKQEECVKEKHDVVYDQQMGWDEIMATENGPQEPKVTICHIPPGNPEKLHTIEVSVASESTHLAHGDYLGECSVSNKDDTVLAAGGSGTLESVSSVDEAFMSNTELALIPLAAPIVLAEPALPNVQDSDAIAPTDGSSINQETSVDIAIESTSTTDSVTITSIVEESPPIAITPTNSTTEFSSSTAETSADIEESTMFVDPVTIDDTINEEISVENNPLIAPLIAVVLADAEIEEATPIIATLDNDTAVTTTIAEITDDDTTVTTTVVEPPAGDGVITAEEAPETDPLDSLTLMNADTEAITENDTVTDATDILEDPGFTFLWNYQFGYIYKHKIPGPSAAIGEIRPDVPGLEIATGNEEYLPLGGSWSDPLSILGRWFLFKANGDIAFWKNTENDQAHSSVNLYDLNGDGILEMLGGTTSGNQVQAIDGDGNWVWRFELGSHSYSTPAIAELTPGIPKVFSGCWDGYLRRIDGKTGQLDWAFIGPDVPYSFGGPYYQHQWIWSSPAVADLDNDGRKEVIIATFGALYASYDNYNYKQFADYYDKGVIYSLDAETGHVNWQQTLGHNVRSSPALADINNDGILDVLIGDGYGVFKAFAGDTGALEWSFEAQGGILSSPAVGDLDGDGDLEIIFGSIDANVYALNGDGTLFWSHSMASGWGLMGWGGRVHSSPALARRMPADSLSVYVTTMDGDLVVMNGLDGNVMAKFSVGFPIATSPVVGDVDGDGKLEVFFQDRRADFFDEMKGDTFWAVRDEGSDVPPFAREWPMFRANPEHTGVYWENQY